LFIGFFIGRLKPAAAEKISVPLISYGIPLSVMGLLLKAGINIDLIKSALVAFLIISLFILLINLNPYCKQKFSNYSLQLGGLIGNTSFLGIPIAIALLPTNIINFTIGFDLGTTIFAWVIGPYFLQKNQKNDSFLNYKKLIFSFLNSPASKGIIGVLLIYAFSLEKYFGNILWIPARIVIFLAIIVVGTRLGIITNKRDKLFELDNEIKYSIILKLLIFPAIIFIVSNLLKFNKLEITALVLQASTPSAISTILMAEAYKTNQDTAAKILFSTTIISIITIPVLAFLLK